MNRAQVQSIDLPFVIQDLTADSRSVRSGMTFLAYPGGHHDGRTHIPEAIRHGAASVLWERQGFEWPNEWPTPNRGVDGLRDQIGPLAAQVYGNPSEALWTVGVTGTNGKTSCSRWIATLLEAEGVPCATIGTLGNGLAGQWETATHTTPDAIALQKLLRRFRDRGAQGCAMEVSSHALDQHRVDGVHFQGGVFTNLTRDHLDYHGTEAAYGQAKARLFRDFELDFAVLNLDDPFSETLLEVLAGQPTRPVGYRWKNRAKPTTLPLVEAVSPQMTDQGLRFLCRTDWGTVPIEARMVGEFNVSNLLAVIATLLQRNIALDQIADGVAKLVPPPGRMERFGGGESPWVVVDYAHTPDALSQALRALRPWVAPGGHLWVVFGCGGQRDPGKRPLMGSVAESLADRVVLTNDNPRNEDPAVILEGIRAGMKKSLPELPDRREAIRTVIDQARVGDVVLIAGKGHETTQALAGGQIPFNDAAVVVECLKERAS